MKSKLHLIFVFLISISAVQFSQSSISDSLGIPNKKRIYSTAKLIGSKPTIDGILNDICWQENNWASDYTQWIPNEGAPPTQKTDLKILYDDENIYVAIRAFDNEPDKISKNAGRRDEFIGDIVGISFDSYHDHRTAFEFDLTAAGQKIDLLLYNPSSWDVSWNAVWNGEVGFEDSAWTAEFEIPFSQLRFSDAEQQVWGMHSWRWIDRFQEESDWEPQSSKGPGIIYQFGELHGLKNLSNAPPIEIIPYTLGELKTFKKEISNPFKKNGKDFLGNAGIDAKIGVTNNFTIDLTVNPDFGQVESDPSVMNLTAFETFYEEKRPFFLEGKNIFDFNFDGNTLFYSRRIGHSPTYFPNLQNGEFVDYPQRTTILSAMKLSGKTANGLAVGVLQSLTANEKAEISDNIENKNVDVEPLTNYLVLRLQQDFDEGNTVIGGIFTSANRFIDNPNLELLANNAYTSGFDFLHNWDNKEYYIDAKIISSYINGSEKSISILQNSSARYFRRPDANHLSYNENINYLYGHGGSVKIGKGSGGLWRYSMEAAWRSPGLELNDVGFVSIVDLIKQNNSISYFVTNPVSIFRTYKIGLNQYNNWDFGLNHLSSGMDLTLYFDLLNQWGISTSFGYLSEQFDTRILRGGNGMLLPPEWEGSFYIRTDPSKNIVFYFDSQFLKSNNNRLENFNFQPGISILPLNTLKLSFSLYYYKNRDELQFVDHLIINNDDKFILGEISQKSFGSTIRIDYNITPELSIQYYGSPFVSIGKYSNFKIVNDAKASNYINRTSSLITTFDDNIYNVINPTTNKPEFNMRNPDFNFFEFRSNLVLRWEYRKGSQIYFVWSQERNNFEMSSNQSINNTLTDLGNLYPTNVFLIKFNYWINI